MAAQKKESVYSKNFIREIESYIKRQRLLEEGMGVVVGVSGGADSMCLLHVLLTLSAKWGLSLFPVHVNHCLRGEESDQDQAYVTEWCLSHNLPIYVLKEDCSKIAGQEGISVEEAGRNLRYRFFRQIADQVGAHRIAVAHHKNDQAETVLLNFFRGTGIDGLSGMKPETKGVIRPLLEMTRAEIERYCEDVGIVPRQDSTNKVALYTRNRIRLEVIPYIEKHFNSNFVETAARMAANIREDGEIIAEAAEEAFNKVTGGWDRYANTAYLPIYLKPFAGLSSPLQKRVLRLAVERFGDSGLPPESRHIDQMQALLISGRTGAEVHLTQGLRLYRTYEYARLEKRENGRTSENEAQTSIGEIAVPIPGRITVSELGLEVVSEIIKGNSLGSGIRDKGLAGSDLPCGNLCDSHLPGRCSVFSEEFDYQSLAEGMKYNKLVIRSRMPGDIFSPLGMGGTKKLKEFFIDSKIPAEIRDSIPLLALGKEIVWVVGCRISEKYRLRPEAAERVRIVVTKKY